MKISNGPPTKLLTRIKHFVTANNREKNKRMRKGECTRVQVRHQMAARQSFVAEKKLTTEKEDHFSNFEIRERPSETTGHQGCSTNSQA